ncbi:MAG: hypothetical protein GWP70_00075 [Proteobacteria bacterium]|nr:hypothetical protein [Pseudomonadota bacterium]
MREFSGIVDLPAALMVVVALAVIALANGFSRRRTVAMAPTALFEASYLFMLITLVAMFEDPLNFMALPYMASFALVTFAIAGVVGMVLMVFRPAEDEHVALPTPKVGLRIAAILAALAGTGYLAMGNTALSGYLQPNAVIFTTVLVAVVMACGGFSSRQSAISAAIDHLPNIAALGMLVAISAAVLDIYELPALLPLLGFGVNVVFLVALIQVIMRLGGWTLAPAMVHHYLLQALLLLCAVGLVLIAEAAA